MKRKHQTVLILATFLLVVLYIHYVHVSIKGDEEEQAVGELQSGAKTSPGERDLAYDDIQTPCQRFVLSPDLDDVVSHQGVSIPTPYDGPYHESRLLPGFVWLKLPGIPDTPPWYRVSNNDFIVITLTSNEHGEVDLCLVRVEAREKAKELFIRLRSDGRIVPFTQ